MRDSDQDFPRYTIAQLKFAALGCLSSCKHQHKTNLIGRGYQVGDVERTLGVTFSSNERLLCAKAVTELIAGGLAEPTYNDLVDPENWITISASGKAALENQALDELDQALKHVDPSLCELRAGASAAVTARTMDSMRQAAHSARELIRQVLARLAPDSAIKSDPSFIPSSEAKSGITRKMRLAYIVAKHHTSLSQEDEAIISATCDLIDALYGRFSAEAHRDSNRAHRDVLDLVQAAEGALLRLLEPLKSSAGAA